MTAAIARWLASDVPMADDRGLSMRNAPASAA
jgi:hypothetical protein